MANKIHFCSRNTGLWLRYFSEKCQIVAVVVICLALRYTQRILKTYYLKIWTTMICENLLYLVVRRKIIKMNFWIRTIFRKGSFFKGITELEHNPVLMASLASANCPVSYEKYVRSLEIGSNQICISKSTHFGHRKKTSHFLNFFTSVSS